MKTLFLLLSGLFILGSYAAQGETEFVMLKGENPTDTYRSDQFSPGVISEYVEVTLSEDRQSIVSVHYWYVARDGMDTFESEKEKLKLKDAKKYTGEEVGMSGELQLPNSDEYLPFIIAEGMFQITHDADRIQSFEKE